MSAVLPSQEGLDATGPFSRSREKAGDEGSREHPHPNLLPQAGEGAQLQRSRCLPFTL
jgi:hypothetical protein